MSKHCIAIRNVMISLFPIRIIDRIGRLHLEKVQIGNLQTSPGSRSLSFMPGIVRTDLGQKEFIVQCSVNAIVTSHHGGVDFFCVPIEVLTVHLVVGCPVQEILAAEQQK